jgi:hypothetical protein
MISSVDMSLNVLRITMKKFAERTTLLLTGLAAAMVAWGYWYVTGASGFQILSAVTLVVVAFENRRLRKRIGQLSAQRNS